MNDVHRAETGDLAASDRWPIRFPAPGTPLHAEWLQHVGDVPKSGSGEIPESGRNSTDAGPAGYLLLSDTRRIPVEHVVVLGRAPQSSALPEHQGATTVALKDEDRVLSRSHVAIIAVAAAIEVIDLDSANGTFLVGTDGAGSRAQPGRRYRVEDGGRIVLAGSIPIMFRLRRHGS